MHKIHLTAVVFLTNISTLRTIDATIVLFSVLCALGFLIFVFSARPMPQINKIYLCAKTVHWERIGMRIYEAAILARYNALRVHKVTATV
jgi:hypothetical protein